MPPKKQKNPRNPSQESLMERGEADNGNRTRILSWEGFCLTLRRYPQGVERLALRENDGLLLGKSGVRHKPERSAWDSNPRMNVDVH